MAPSKRSTDSTVESTSRRRSGRLSASGQKSKYFEAESDGGETLDSELDEKTQNNSVPVKRKRGRPSKKDGDADRPNGKKARLQAAKDEEDDEADGYIDEGSDEKNGNDNDDDEDDELDEDAPPRVTIIPHKKMRDTGGVAYEDEKLHHNTLLFLKDLKANNKRSWLKC